MKAAAGFAGDLVLLALVAGLDESLNLRTKASPSKDLGDGLDGPNDSWMAEV